MITKVIIPEKYKDRFFKKDYFEFSDKKRINLLYGCNGIGKSTLLNIIANMNKKRSYSKQENEPKEYYKKYMNCNVPKIAFYRASVDCYKRAGQDVNTTALDCIENFEDYWFAINSSEGQAISELFLSWLNKLDDDIDVLLIDELDSGLSPIGIYMCAYYINEWIIKHSSVQCFIGINNYEWVRLFKKIYRMDNGEYQEVKDYEEFFEITKEIHLNLYEG